MVNSPFCSKQKPQNKTPPERCTRHSSEGGFSSKSRFHFCLSLKAGNGGAPHGDTSRRGSRRVLSGRTLRGGLQTGFQPVACSLCADGMRRYSARINAFILLPLYYSGAAQGSQGRTKTIQNARRVALGIFSGRIILNFGISERLRALRYPIFTGGAVRKNAAYHCDSSREKGTPERPQTLRGSEIINLLSAEIAQSEAERN